MLGVSPRYDVVVVGAGIVGLATARELLRRQPEANLIVLDGADRVAAHQSSHNSGVIHAGVYYTPGSLKAQLCVAGAARLYAYCAEQGIEARRVGKLIIATRPDELAGLEELERRARANGVPGIRRLRGQEIDEIEPQARGLAALHSPMTGIVDFGTVCRHLAEDVRQARGELALGWTVERVQELGRRVRLTGSDGRCVEASAAVFCAGLQSDRLARQAGAPADPRILPFRGAYLRLRPERRELVRGLIYPVPDPALPFLGVHLTRGVDGDVLAGPTALLVGARDAYRLRRLRARDLADTLSWPGTWRMFAGWWRTGAREVHLAWSRQALARELARFVPALQAQDLEPAFAGIRAQTVTRDGRLIDDFLLAHTERTIHVRNAPSPAATSALALAGMIADQVRDRWG